MNLLNMEPDYYGISEAVMMVYTLNENEKDGWTYTLVQTTNSDYVIIEVLDENGEHVGYWNEG